MNGKGIFAALGAFALLGAPAVTAVGLTAPGAAHAQGKGNGGDRGNGANGGGRGADRGAGQERSSTARAGRNDRPGRGTANTGRGRSGEAPFGAAQTGLQRLLGLETDRPRTRTGQARQTRAPGTTARPTALPVRASTAPPQRGARGLLASELKGLNAVHASPTARANAAPESQVGRIETYRLAALDTIEKADAFDRTQADLELLRVTFDRPADEDLAMLADAVLTLEEELAAAVHGNPVADGTTPPRSEAEIIADIAVLQATLDTVAEFDQDEAALLADLATAEANLAVARDAEAAALDGASGGRDLSDAAVDYVRTTLGL